IRRSPNGAHHARPQPGRDRPERVVAINRNDRSQSSGTGGRDHPVRAVTAAPAEIFGWFVQRWSMETTFQEARDHLGVETQRQWSDRAIARTTPALLGLFSLVTIWAN